ncbi:hypothetical protein cand_031220 [Cryptosporidium andersoni]|uniref:Uncharacterized protein n=1 Tax=Cryptosporidium andersoni TaxID=117008 RepID=A0A1J4MRR0_9CRYT|nr:hypothetical protein cand_031220 [Cryptosporidium andersoni]
MGKGTSNIVDKGLSQQNRRFEVTKPNNYCENLAKLIAQKSAIKLSFLELADCTTTTIIPSAIPLRDSYNFYANSCGRKALNIVKHLSRNIQAAIYCYYPIMEDLFLVTGRNRLEEKDAEMIRLSFLASSLIHYTKQDLKLIDNEVKKANAYTAYYHSYSVLCKKITLFYDFWGFFMREIFWSMVYSILGISAARFPVEYTCPYNPSAVVKGIESSSDEDITTLMELPLDLETE